MEPILVYPDPPPPELAQTLDLAGYPWKATSTVEGANRMEPSDGWAGAVIVADTDPESAWAFCRTVRKKDVPLAPLLLLVSGAQLADLELRDDLFDDFCLSPFHPASSRPASSTSSGRRAAAPDLSWWSTARWCSTWRPTRPT